MAVLTPGEEEAPGGQGASGLRWGWAAVVLAVVAGVWAWPSERDRVDWALRWGDDARAAALEAEYLTDPVGARPVLAGFVDAGRPFVDPDAFAEVYVQLVDRSDPDLHRLHDDMVGLLGEPGGRAVVAAARRRLRSVRRYGPAEWAGSPEREWAETLARRAERVPALRLFAEDVADLGWAADEFREASGTADGADASLADAEDRAGGGADPVPVRAYVTGLLADQLYLVSAGPSSPPTATLSTALSGTVYQTTGWVHTYALASGEPPHDGGLPVLIEVSEARAHAIRRRRADDRRAVPEARAGASAAQSRLARARATWSTTVSSVTSRPSPALGR